MSIWQLFGYDRRLIAGWFRHHWVSKIVVIVGFLFVAALTWLGIYAMAFGYFTMLAGYPPVGQLISNYLIHACVLVVVGIGTVSTVAGLRLSLFGQSLFGQALTLPISTRLLVAYGAIKLIVSNTLLGGLLLTPIGLSFYRAFGYQASWWGFMAMAMVVIWGLSIGMVIYSWGFLRFGHLKRWQVIVMGAGLLGLTFAGFRLLLPRRLFLLYSAADVPEFAEGLSRLPLLHRFLPTTWLARMASEPTPANMVLALGMTLGLGLLAKRMIVRIYDAALHDAQEAKIVAGPVKHLKISKPWPRFRQTTLTLWYAQIAGTWRQTKEAGYYGFVVGLAVVLVGLLSLVPTEHGIDSRWLPLVYQSSLAGFGYLMTVLAMRFIFPMRATDTPSWWWLKSMPVGNMDYLDAKLLAGASYLLPMTGVSLVLAFGLPLALSQQVVFWLLLLGLGLAMAVAHLALGLKIDTGGESNNPEVVSTSGRGLGALGISLGLIWWVMTGFTRYMEGVSLAFGLTLGGLLLLIVGFMVYGWLKVQAE